MDIIEKLFGKRPAKGYDFQNIEVETFRWEITDPDHIQEFGDSGKDVIRAGIVIKWLARGIGFGEVTLRIKDDHIDVDTECMSDEFITALLKAAAPKIIELLKLN